MKIVTQTTLRISLLISAILFFNYMYRLLDTSTHVNNVYHDGHKNIPMSNKFSSTPKKESLKIQPLKGKEHFHTWLMIVYVIFVMFKYKTFNEQMGLYVAFFIIINLSYYPFNCACKEPVGWTCKVNTAPEDERCQQLLKEIQGIDDIVYADLEAIRVSKARVVDTLIKKNFPVFPVPEMPIIPETAFNLPHLPPIGRVMPRIRFSCPMSAKAIWNALKKRVFNKIGKPFRKKKWGKRFRR